MVEFYVTACGPENWAGYDKLMAGESLSKANRGDLHWDAKNSLQVLLVVKELIKTVWMTNKDRDAAGLADATNLEQEVRAAEKKAKKAMEDIGQNG